MSDKKREHEKAAEIVRDAGGQVVGRTKLQKIGYLLELAGCGDGFYFEYRHYGPYSEDLARAISVANAFDLVEEEERKATWGGMYSIYTASEAVGERVEGPRAELAATAAQFGSIELELAATAAYLSAVEGCEDPWKETARRKPNKIGDGRLEGAKEAYRQLSAIRTPTPLPQFE